MGDGLSGTLMLLDVGMRMDSGILLTMGAARGYLVNKGNYLMPFRNRIGRVGGNCVLRAWLLVAVCVAAGGLTGRAEAGDDSATPTGSLINPSAIMFNRASGKVYAVDTLGDAVYVSDDAAGSMKRVKVGAGPVSIAVDEKNGCAYVANAGDGTVSVIDGHSDAVVAVVPIGSHPYSIAADSGRGRIYVTRTYSNSLTVIDDATNHASEVKAIGADLVTVNLTTHAIYLLAYEGGNVMALDGTSYSKKEATAGMHGWGIVVDSETGTVYVLRTHNAEVAVFGSDLALEKRIAVGGIPSAVAFNSRTKTLYVSNYDDDTLTVINMKSGAPKATVPVGHHPEGVAVDAERDLVFVANTHGNSVTVIDGATNKVRSTIAAGKAPYALAYNPVSKKLHIANVGGAPVTMGEFGGTQQAMR
jgi:YVTN family beta-propeller protein